ncbi:MAG: hypothetical protein K2Y29_12690 [Beijerinckiaceae bacterium]|nr:hypothetical protein [Beijerinckiaceae bacterium]
MNMRIGACAGRAPRAALRALASLQSRISLILRRMWIGEAGVRQAVVMGFILAERIPSGASTARESTFA